MAQQLKAPVTIATLFLATSPSFAAEPAWVTASNANTKIVLDLQARFNPEQASGLGLAAYGGLVSDLAPGRDDRLIAASSAVQVEECLTNTPTHVQGIRDAIAKMQDRRL
jgi:hypothetical protein